MGRGVRAGVAAGLGLAAVLTGGTAGAADTKAPDWSGFVTVSDVVGEVVKADDKGLTLRVTWYATQGGTGGRGRRPSLSANHRNFHNPYSMARRRSGGGSRPQVKQEHHDYDLEYVPQSLVRYKALPAKLDAKGRPVPYTDQETHDLRQPTGVPGYAATKADVTGGMVVELVLVRDKAIAPAKATEDDLRVKYVYLLGHAKDAPGSGPSPGADAKKAN